MNITWQPADTAPRDGTPFVARLNNAALALLRWPRQRDGTLWPASNAITWDTPAGGPLVAIDPECPAFLRIVAWHEVLPIGPTTPVEAIRLMRDDGDADPEGTARLNYPWLFDGGER